MALETVAITDAGGRGAALAHAYGMSPHVGKLILAPGNDLMSLNIPEHIDVEYLPVKLAAGNAEQIAQLLQGKASIVDVCQDDVVAGGLVNHLQRLGVPAIGPTQQAGELEWNKRWSREFMVRHDIPHPTFRAFTSVEPGLRFLQEQEDQAWAVKASGLAQGKGVEIVENNNDAMQAIRALQKYGSEYLLEQRLVGEEFSIYAVSDGQHYQVLGGAQDHKLLLDGDRGPNTGGMGAYSQPGVLTPGVMRQVHSILQKTFDGMREEGRPYTGVLYLGGMVVGGNQVYVIEDNARWGDPEAQVVVPGIQTDLFEIGRAVIEQRIHDLIVKTDNEVRVAVALTAKGYPDAPIRGKEVRGLNKASDTPCVTVYGAGIKREGERFVSNGGRIAYVVGKGANIVAARNRAYEAMKLIQVEDDAGHFRKDIGWRDVERVTNA